MYLVILLAAAAILGGVVVVAMGRGGEMALFDRDLPVKITRLETPDEVATLRLPFGLVGYQARATGEALIAAAKLLAQRDAEIAALRREIWRQGGNERLGGDERLGGNEQLVGPDAAAAAPDFTAPRFGASSYAPPPPDSYVALPDSYAAPPDSYAAPADFGEADDRTEEAPVASDLGQDQTGRP